MLAIPRGRPPADTRELVSRVPRVGVRAIDLPPADSQVEAILMRSVVAEFARRLGTSVDARFHRRYVASDCALRLPTPELATHEPIQLTVTTFMCEWLNRFREAFAAAHDSPAHHARRYLDGHFRENVTSSDLGRLIGIERRSLDRQFRSEIGATVTEYRTRLRVIDALPELRAGEKADAIALRVGWRARKDLYRGLWSMTGASAAEIRGLSDDELQDMLDRLRAGERRSPNTH